MKGVSRCVIWNHVCYNCMSYELCYNKFARNKLLDSFSTFRKAPFQSYPMLAAVTSHPFLLSFFFSLFQFCSESSFSCPYFWLPFCLHSVAPPSYLSPVLFILPTLTNLCSISYLNSSSFVNSFILNLLARNSLATRVRSCSFTSLVPRSSLRRSYLAPPYFSTASCYVMSSLHSSILPHACRCYVTSVPPFLTASCLLKMLVVYTSMMRTKCTTDCEGHDANPILILSSLISLSPRSPLFCSPTLYRSPLSSLSLLLKCLFSRSDETQMKSKLHFDRWK